MALNVSISMTLSTDENQYKIDLNIPGSGADDQNPIMFSVVDADNEENVYLRFVGVDTDTFHAEIGPPQSIMPESIQDLGMTFEEFPEGKSFDKDTNTFIDESGND